MINLLYKYYGYFFCRKLFLKFHIFLYKISLSGIGVMNWVDSKVSGELFVLKEILKHKSDFKPVIVDVGANEGDYISDVLNVNKNVEVFAFEPNSEVALRCSKRFSDLDNITVIESGLGCKSGIGELFVGDLGSPSSHATAYQGVLQDLRNVGARRLPVSIKTLDEYWASLENAPAVIDLLKIDVEGMELDVLNGATELISDGRIMNIQFEFNEMNVFSRTFFKDFWDKFQSEFVFYRLMPDGLALIKNYNPIYCEIFAYQNILMRRRL